MNVERFTSDPLPYIGRAAIALVWLHQGLWHKLLAPSPAQTEIVGSVPGLSLSSAGVLLTIIGVIEVACAAWVLCGWRPRAAAASQTAMLVGMNGGGLIWASARISDPAGMIVQNIVFLTLIWITASNRGTTDVRH